VLLRHPITVQIACDVNLNAGATYGPSGTLVFNLMGLSHTFFARPNHDEEVLGLILHEFAHEFVRDHLSDEYHRTCCRLGARLAVACVAQPDLLRQGCR